MALPRNESVGGRSTIKEIDNEAQHAAEAARLA